MNIALIGYGKMGKEIEKIAIERGHKIELIIDNNNIDDLNNKNLQNIDVAIEFTKPETAYQNYLKCFSANTPVVSGTTGWLDKFSLIEEKCKNEGQTFFYASNFSLGVNIFFEINNKLSKIMNNFPAYNVSMEETHHTQKLDSPSGTAITLAEEIINNIDRKTGWKEAEKVDSEELKIEALRIDNVPGVHTINYESDIDSITINHSAKSRKGFALGAVLAAEYSANNSGLLNMKNLLKL